MFDVDSSGESLHGLLMQYEQAVGALGDSGYDSQAILETLLVRDLTNYHWWPLK